MTTTRITGDGTLAGQVDLRLDGSEVATAISAHAWRVDGAVAEPVVVGERGKAAFDAVDPLLLVGTRTGPAADAALPCSPSGVQVMGQAGVATCRR